MSRSKFLLKEGWGLEWKFIVEGAKWVIFDKLEGQNYTFNENLVEMYWTVLTQNHTEGWVLRQIINCQKNFFDQTLDNSKKPFTFVPVL
jgi:hypothetical protein